ncbi:hypothetical protein [Nocardia farcinica]|uniref:hypothetical protein n=1 Tax=Nocardia farcinica TaxID=37329 RepID=UPI001EBFAF9A|nr:hypothetical protein [Nocardia farcinica]MBF6522850.1 hypothetical protein [Nocardia farcinica]
MDDQVADSFLAEDLRRSATALPYHARGAAEYWLSILTVQKEPDEQTISALVKWLSNARLHPQSRAALLAYLGDSAPSLKGRYLWCLRELPQREPGRAGRPALYCGQNHRQDACRARRRTARSATADLGGRPRAVDADKRRTILARRAEGQSLREIARGVGVSLAVVHGEVKASELAVDDDRPMPDVDK